MSYLEDATRAGGSTALFDLLPQGLRDAIIAIASLERYSAGKLIHSRGDSTPGISIVRTGMVNIGVYGLDGTFVVASVLGPGEAFGEFTLFTDLPRTHDVSALGNCEVYQIPGKPFLRLCDERPQILSALLKSNLVRTHMLLEMLDAMRRLPVLERTAKTILSMSYTSGSATELVCRQNDLAQSIGVSRVTLGKVLKQLEAEQLINIGYGKIGLYDRHQLEAWLAERSTTPLNVNSELP